MLIPHAQLAAATLDTLLEDFVTRDGTDNGDETPLATRTQRARPALEPAEAVILFDPDSALCQLVLRRDVPPELLND